MRCLVPEGVHRRSADGTPEFVEVPAPTDEALPSVLHKIITRTMKPLNRQRVLIEEGSSTYMADSDSDSEEARLLRPLQAAANSGIRAEAVDVGAQRLPEVFLPWHRALHRQHLLASAWSEGGGSSTANQCSQRDLIAHNVLKSGRKDF